MGDQQGTTEMTVELGTFSKGSPGNTTVVLNTAGFTPDRIRFKVSQKFNTSDTANHLSEGVTNGTSSQYTSHFTDGTGSQTKEGTNKVISHWARVGGVLTEVVAATVVSIGEEEFTLNFSVADANYRIHMEATG